MQEISRRKMLLTAAARFCRSGCLCAGVCSRTQQRPDMDSVRNRMMTVEKRGTTLTEEQKYWVLLSTCAAQGLDDETEEITASALKAGVKPGHHQGSDLSDFPVCRNRSRPPSA